MATRRPSVRMKDVAALAGVSLGTVSNVVNSPTLVSEETRQRVQEAIAKLGWVPNESARQLKAGRSRAIGMVVMDLANPFFTGLILGADEYVQERGYFVQVSNSANRADREQAHLELLEQQRVGGVLLAPISGLSPQVRQLTARRGIPVVTLHQAGGTADVCSVAVDDVEGGQMAVQHLIDQGHTRIALVGGSDSSRRVRDRRTGARIARATGRPVELLVVPTPSLDAESGTVAAHELTRLPARERPTAVFAANDLVAIGVLQGLLSQGVRVPEDVAVVGYDDVLYAASSAVPLSSVRQPSTALGRRAAELLFEEMLAVGQDEEHHHQVVRFRPELVVRRSSSAPAASAGAR